MKKIINYLKGLLSNKPRLEERYTLNRKYLGRSEDLKIFIEKRQYHCDMLGMKFSVIEDDFPDCQYGFVELLQNGKIVESVLLKRGDLGLVLWVEFGNRKVLTDREMKTIKINEDILNYINNHKPPFEFIPKLGSLWKVEQEVSYPNVNGGYPVIELSNSKGEWLRLPKSIIDNERTKI